MGKRVSNKQLPGAVATLEAPVAPEVSPEAIAAAAQRRSDELSTARKRYLTATGGARQPDGLPSGGSDLVGRALRALKLLDGKDYLDVDTLIDVLGRVDNAKLIEWGKTYIAGLVANKGNERRIRAFSTFCAADGFRALQFAVSTFKNHRAWQFGETVKNPKTGKTITFTVDVVRELNDMFALKLTNSRRARHGVAA